MKPWLALIAAAAPALVLAGAPLAAEPPADGADRGAVEKDPDPWADVTGRLRAGPGGLSLELGETKVELKLAGGGEQAGGWDPSGAASGASELRATFTVNGKATELLLRITPPPADARAPAK
jgi:hypothetical protein